MSLLKSPLMHVSALTFLAMFNLTFVVPSIKEMIIDSYGATPTEASLFVTVEMLAYIIFGVVWGALSDRRGERRIFIAIGFFGSAMLYYTMSLAPDLVTMLVLRFAQGALTVMAWSLLMTMALDMARPSNYGASMGVVGAGLALGIGLGAPMGGLVGDLGTYYPLYFASATFLLATALSVLLIKDMPIRARPESVIGAIRHVIRDRRVLVPYVFSLGERFSAGFLVILLPLYMAYEFDSSPGERGLYLAAFLLPFALLQYPFGRISDQYGRKWMLIGGGFVYALLLAMIGAVDQNTMLLVMAISGCFAAMLFPASLGLLADIAPPAEHATAMGGFNSFGSVGFALGPLVAASLSQTYDYPLAFTVGGIIIGFTVLASLPLFRLLGADDEYDEESEEA